MQSDASYSDIAKETGSRIAEPVKATTDATIGSAGRAATKMINRAQDFISVVKRGEDVINEMNGGGALGADEGGIKVGRRGKSGAVNVFQTLYDFYAL